MVKRAVDSGSAARFAIAALRSRTLYGISPTENVEDSGRRGGPASAKLNLESYSESPHGG